MASNQDDGGPRTHSERLKVDYDQVMYAVFRAGRRFCTPGIRSGLPELADLLGRPVGSFTKQFCPTDYDHAPSTLALLQVIEALQSREAVAEIAALADCVTLPRSLKAAAVGAPADTAAAFAALPVLAEAALRNTVARLESGKPLSSTERTEARDALFDLAAYIAHLVTRVRLP